ncbi:DUF3892 domain-containing protein [Algoriphagus pacificus]|uniref:DUF3892 domain-containing protein n=1 Tax=Algoriphagus pacificus TaxID=2811234 RepID=A0ABS3CMW0_9BACT|nr:DUF3892 domain-containing protein [Algoriphagus pacificus]MBN7816984.1 DUF3892 domain-containing protein [Algoriphagus pacificus]
MKRLRILCTKKVSRTSLQGSITHIGGVNGTGEKWTVSTKEAINGILSGEYEFYLLEKRDEIPVLISGEQEKHLFAIGKESLTNLLEELPDCP